MFPFDNGNDGDNNDDKVSNDDGLNIRWLCLRWVSQKIPYGACL